MTAVPAVKRHTLLARLLLAYLLPTLGLLGAFGFLAHRIAARSLEQSLGRQLVGIAQAAVSQLRPESIEFLSPGDDGSRTARRLKQRLKAVRERTGVARIFVIDRDHRGRIDTEADVRIGDRYYHAEADRVELDRVFSGDAVSSVLFRGTQGQYFKTGYAPLSTPEGRVVAALGVEGSAAFYADLNRLSQYLAAAGVVIALLVVLISAAFARRLTRPLRRLAEEARRIGAGELDQPIAITGKDEVGLLASTMNDMRESIRARDEELQLMLSGIAHEVRNPLGGIALFSGLLRDELAEEPDRLKHLHRIEKELDTLKNVVEEFLAYTRRQDLERRPVPMAPLIQQVFDLAGPLAKTQEVSLQCDAPQDIHAMGDRQRLSRALLNLVQNAIQASAPGSTVRVTAESVEVGLAIRIRDTGTGIPQDAQAKIFTPFFTTREKGTGLGLALVQKIIKEHGGTLDVESAVSQGTTVTVYLPAA